MKKMILMAAMMVAAVATASAQARFEPGTFTLQPRIGGTGALFSNAPDLNVNGKTVDATATGGGFTGVDLEYYYTSRIGFAAGINWSVAGTGWEDYKYTGSDGINYKVKESAIKTQYISVPLTANWYVARGLAVKTGVQLGFMVSANNYTRAEYSSLGVDYTLTAEYDAKDDYKKFDVMIPVGLSYDFKFPFVIDFRYNIGLTKVNKNATASGDDYRNMQAVLTLGYKFKL